MGQDYPHPLLMRDWELWRVLEAMESAGVEDRILEVGSFNTYLGVYLARRHTRVTASDRLARRFAKSVLRSLGAAPKKPAEAPYFQWTEAMRRGGVEVRSHDVTGIASPDASFDRVIALSVIEHVPRIERALSELYRVLAPGGRLLITTDCAPEPKPYADGVRFFSPDELGRLFAPYPVTSARNEPDFSRENWHYGGARPLLPVFVEITKPPRTS